MAVGIINITASCCEESRLYVMKDLRLLVKQLKNLWAARHHSASRT